MSDSQRPSTIHMSRGTSSCSDAGTVDEIESSFSSGGLQQSAVQSEHPASSSVQCSPVPWPQFQAKQTTPSGTDSVSTKGGRCERRTRAPPPQPCPEDFFAEWDKVRKFTAGSPSWMWTSALSLSARFATPAVSIPAQQTSSRDMETWVKRPRPRQPPQPQVASTCRQPRLWSGELAAPIAHWPHTGLQTKKDETPLETPAFPPSDQNEREVVQFEPPSKSLGPATLVSSRTGS
jgi:hypothetical protein